MKNNKKTLIKIFVVIVILISIFLIEIKVQAENVRKGKWIVVEDEMSKPRYPVTANLLPDGNVLIMGGDDSKDTADIFDPNQNKIIKTIQLNDKKFYDYNATSLINGNVLITGGAYRDIHSNNAKLFNFKTYSFQEIGNIDIPLFYSSAINLKDGNVLIIPWHGNINNKIAIYNPLDNKFSYFNEKNMHSGIGKYYFQLENGNIIFFYGKQYLYNINNHTLENYKKLPQELLYIQLDNENYLSIKPEKTYSIGYVTNINTEKITPVKNKINRTFRFGADPPKLILLNDGNVLIFGINLKNNSDEYHLSGKSRKTAKYSVNIYDKKENKFYEVTTPPYHVYGAGIVVLKNGDVMIAGGYYNNSTKRKIKGIYFSNKIQIYKKEK